MKKIPNYRPIPIVFIALASLVVLGFIIQFEAIYSEYIFSTNKTESEITFCFFSPYYLRWLVQILGIMGLLLSSSILYKRDWKFFKAKLENLILLSPVGIFILDKIIVMY